MNSGASGRPAQNEADSEVGIGPLHTRLMPKRRPYAGGSTRRQKDQAITGSKDLTSSPAIRSVVQTSWTQDLVEEPSNFGNLVNRSAVLQLPVWPAAPATSKEDQAGKIVDGGQLHSAAKPTLRE